jgi:hypothetical protein
MFIIKFRVEAMILHHIRSKGHFRDARLSDSLYDNAMSAQLHSPWQITGAYESSDPVETRNKRKSKADHARVRSKNVRFRCPTHIFFNQIYFRPMTQSSPIPTYPICRRHQSLPRSFGLLLQQFPLDIPTLQIDIRYQSTPNYNRNSHQKQIDG